LQLIGVLIIVLWLAIIFNPKKPNLYRIFCIVNSPAFILRS